MNNAESAMETDHPVKRRKVDDGNEMQTPQLPARPRPFLASSSWKEFEDGMKEVMENLSNEAEVRDKVQKPCRTLRTATEAAIRKLLEGEEVDLSEPRALMTTFLERLAESPDWMRSTGFPSSTISAFIGVECLAHFFSTGKILRKAELTLPTDLSTPEYLLGVVRFADEIEAYALGRAMWKDIQSVSLCSRLMNEMNSAYMDFNFRNGPLRQRYDSLKYRVRKLENMVFELSLLQSNEEQAATSKAEEDKAEPDFLSKDEFAEMSADIDKMNEAREVVIKASREPQKDSKNAIYALHRGSMKDARELLSKAVASLKQIAETTTMSKGELNSGAYAGALEEFAEALIFEHWLQTGAILSYPAMKTQIDISHKDYLGGVVDFTGELGRLGVAQATKRNVDKVKEVLSTLLAVKEYAIQLQEIVGKNITKKLEATITNTRKMENVLYELILVTQSNRRAMELSSTEEEAAPAGRKDD